MDIALLNPPEKVFAFGASPSMVALWQLCKRKWWLHYIARRGRSEREAQKDSGSAFHTFFQNWYDPAKGSITLEQHLEQFKIDFPEAESTEKRDQKHMLEVLKAYTNHYPRESEPFKVLSCEQEIRVPVPGCELPLNIKIDNALEWMNGLWVMDHKTTNFLGATYFEQFRNNWQTYTYTWGATQHFKRKCEGILYNAVGMKKKIDRESFLRKEFTKTSAQLDFHMAQWIKTVNEMYQYVLKNWKSPEVFDMSTGPACRAYNVNCPFLDYCEFNGNEAVLPS